jgi:hypothetical protein
MKQWHLAVLGSLRVDRLTAERTEKIRVGLQHRRQGLEQHFLLLSDI